ncbi:putative autophagy-related 12 variant 1 [Besnoitia besnoiti]|uniref:Ubiquitin-like protein ATG12 n=1 Tax=Besnoitia besnoiti TaxID=94643 RepID=A0A2A9M5Y9_BESBE|nr:putative autophagy-related 12 variant 1 [Besnoitia besnoiti]PFH33375.1 putative autophagy-related 12 variant 1 [Besnoitia besnoiti]
MSTSVSPSTAVTRLDSGAEVRICLMNVGGAARLRVSRFKVDAYQRFDAVIGFLKKALKKDLLYVYVNNFIQPQPDEFVADLFEVSGSLAGLVVSVSA